MNQSLVPTGCADSQWHSSSFRIASIPGRDCENPYIKLFYDALETYGIEQVASFDVDSRWFSEHGRGIDAIHIHWPEWIWREYTPGLFRTLYRYRVRGAWRLLNALSVPRQLGGLSKFRHFLETAKQRGMRLLWTFHNAEHHEGAGRFDAAGYRLLASAADLIVCHSRSAREQCLAQLRPAGQVVVMPYGNYKGVYPTPRPRSVVLDELGLSPDRPVLSCLGLIRPYKGIDIALEAAAILGNQVQLVIGGECTDSDVLTRLQEQVKRMPWVRLIPRRLSEQEFADILSGSDAALLPYRKITGSSALLAALTFHRGVIATDLPFFQEFLEPEPEAGVLVPRENTAALAEAIVQYLVQIPAERRARAACRLSDNHDWSRVVRPVVEVIQGWSALKAPVVAGFPKVE